MRRRISDHTRRVPASLGRRLSSRRGQICFCLSPFAFTPSPSFPALLVRPEAPPLARRPSSAASPAFLAPQASQTPIALALHLQRPAPSSISPFLGWNHARNRWPPLTLTRAPPLTADGPFPPLLNPIQGSGELHRALLHLPDPFSLDFGRRSRWERVSPPLAAARPMRGRSVRACGPLPRAPRPLGLPEARAAPSRRRLAPP